MQKIIEYGVAYGDPLHIAAAVNKAISEGWQPMGSMSVVASAKDGESGTAYQPMVKYAPTREITPYSVTLTKGGE